MKGGTMFFVGADVSRGRWLTVKLSEGGSWGLNLFQNIGEMWDTYNTARLILLDVPIGLRDEGDIERLCDKEARKRLSDRRSSVFRAPCRGTLDAGNYEDAKRVNQSRTGKSLSIQSWGIIPKIREVDKFLNDNIIARSRIKEIHPEICFWALNGGESMKSNKKEEEGFLERIRVLRRFCSHTDNIFEFATQEYRGEVANHDILDAIVAAVTAFLVRWRLLTLPEKPEVDSKGLPMEMVYYLHPS